jgi:CHAD domain-containing protein
MAYHFSHEYPTVQDAVRKIAVEQIDNAITAFDRHEPGEAIHQARKSCKKLRGLMRLVRPVFPDYAGENVAIRDAARQLSWLRDSDVMVKTYDTVVKAYGDQIERPAFAPIRRYYTLRTKRAMKNGGKERIELFREAMGRAKQRAADWRLEKDGFDALAEGLSQTYRHARRALRVVQVDTNTEAIHELRKGVKYHWYHTRLLQPIWPDTLKVRREAARILSEYLGDHHDLAVFSSKLIEDQAMFSGQRDLQVMFALLHQRQGEIAAKALPLSRRLLAERSGALRGEWRTYWDVWQQEKPQKPTGQVVLAA